MKKARFFSKLAVQTSIYFLVAAILAVSLISVLLYSTLSSIVLDQTVIYTKSQVENSGIYVNTYLNKLEGVSKSLATNPQVQRYIGCCAEDEAALRMDVLGLIDANLMADEFLHTITIVIKDGRMVSNEDLLNMSVSNDIMEEEWYKQAVASSGIPVLTGARMTEFTMDKDTWVISMAMEIKDENDQHMGVVLIDFDYKGIEDYIMHSELGDEGYAFIIDKDNRLVFHNDPTYFDNQEKLTDLIDVTTMNVGYDKKSNTLVHKYDLNNDSWVLYGVASLDELSAIQQRMMNAFLLTGLLLLILVTGIGVIMSRRVTRPISLLEKRMSEFHKDFERIEVDKTACYEARSLTHRFNEMTDTIKTLMAEIEENERSLRVYELNVLRSQINPHFLYNTLDTIIWMAEFKDHQKVIDITKALATLFRISLSEGRELISIDDELNHVQQYLFIQKQRYDRMDYSLKREESLSQIMIPKLILQPIVENAIYHGIKEKPGNSNIDINVYREDENIVFSIIDDGVGFDTSEAVSQKNTNLKLGGVGIKNVDSRIKLQYGGDSGVYIESKLGEGATVKIKLQI